MVTYTPKGVPEQFFNIVPFLKNVWKWNVPLCLDPIEGGPMDIEKLARILPREMALQELNLGVYADTSYVEIPPEVLELYSEFRPTPLLRARNLEKALGLKGTRVYFKREDTNEIGSYKLNSSYVQAYYAAAEGVKEFIGDTGPGNWGMGLAVAGKRFGIPVVIYMEEANYRKRLHKVKVMERNGAKVVPISTSLGTIAASVSVAVQHVQESKFNRLSLGCLTAYSALHNTVIGMELRKQLSDLDVHPDVLVGVCGGGSSFSGLVFPFIGHDAAGTEFLAVESDAVPSFSKGEYRYENPDLIGLMPRTMMYTLGVDYVPPETAASGLNYHGKNPLLSLLVHRGIVSAVSYSEECIQASAALFESEEGISVAPESAYAVHGAIEKAKALNGRDKTVIFTVTGNRTSLDA